MESREEIDFILQIPQNFREATKRILQILIQKVQPVVLTICDKLRSCSDLYEVIRVRDIYTLCYSQIKKCIISLLDVFRLEYNQGILLQESRQCYLERLQWCINRLVSINVYLGKLIDNLPQDEDTACTDSINVTVMYFINWIDNTFELLDKLSEAVYRTDYKDHDISYTTWKNDMVEYISELNGSIDELLLSAMTLCKYCLPADQHIVMGRCQVVFRETKALLSEIIQGDLSSTVKINPDILRLPIMPSNVNVLILILRTVLYVLETNTNTALLALLIYCFSNSMSPIDLLKQHFENSTKGTCLCVDKKNGDITQDCVFVKEFDLYNERLLQIGSFAVSCSSDQNRTLNLRSGLASLEGLDPHLVPALMMSPNSHHSKLLVNSWRQEVKEIRDSVFLIVDPAAFIDRSKQMMRQKLLDMLESNVYNNNETCSIINIGCVVYDFFEVYEQNEPDALMHREKVLPLLADLKKVQNECKIVSNLLSSSSDFRYEIKTSKSKKVSFDQLVKRLKLLYTVVNRIDALLNPNDNDDQLLDEDAELKYDDVTQSNCKNIAAYDNTPRKQTNLSRAIFSRTMNVLRSSKKKFPLAILTKNLRAKKHDEISFSVQLDRLLNETYCCDNQNGSEVVMRDCLDGIREPSILYNFSLAKRSSMRQVILNRHCMSYDKLDETRLVEESVLDMDSFMDDTSLQITNVLNQINDLTNILSTNNMSSCSFTNKPVRRNQTHENDSKDKGRRNVLALNINNRDTIITERVCNIPTGISRTGLDNSELASNTSTPPSNVTSMERLYDLDLVESKLNSLKSQLETSL